VKFVRAGIILRNLSPAAGQQAFEQFHLPHEGQEISTLIETINKKYCRGFVGLAHAGMRQGPSWQVKRNNVSPRVTTQWDELATAKAA
jgi:DNA polymerase V